jgi:hypothetical protein
MSEYNSPDKWVPQKMDAVPRCSSNFTSFYILVNVFLWLNPLCTLGVFPNKNMANQPEVLSVNHQDLVGGSLCQGNCTTFFLLLPHLMLMAMMAMEVVKPTAKRFKLVITIVTITPVILHAMKKLKQVNKNLIYKESLSFSLSQCWWQDSNP